MSEVSDLAAVFEKNRKQDKWAGWDYTTPCVKCGYTLGDHNGNNNCPLDKTYRFDRRTQFKPQTVGDYIKKLKWE